METTISTIDGARCDERLCIVLCQNFEIGSRIELRQQSWGEGLGWYTQNTVSVDPEQVGELRNALGGMGSRPQIKGGDLESKIRRGGFSPRVIHADSA